MGKLAKQRKVKLDNGFLQAEENTLDDNNLLPAADELKQLVQIDKNILQWILNRTEIEQDARINFNNNRMLEFQMQGKRTFIINIISLIMAFFIIVGGGLASIFLALNGLLVEGSILGGVTLVAAAGIFLKKNKQVL